MDFIKAPIIRNDRGAAVRNLQDGLMLLLSIAHPERPQTDQDGLVDRIADEQRQGVYGNVTTEAVARFQRENIEAFHLPLTTGEQVDEPTAGMMNGLLKDLGAFRSPRVDDFIVTGRVEFEDGSPAAGVGVGVFDRDLGFVRVLLGDPQRPVITGDDGIFPAVRYKARDFAVGEGRSGRNADLVFSVTSTNDETFEVASIFRELSVDGRTIESEVPDLILGFEAAQVEEVRIVLAGHPRDRGLSEYKRLVRDLGPLLINEATPADLNQDKFRDFDFAARETGWDRSLVESMALAWQLARAATREPQLFAETFYGLLRYGPPTEVPPLAATLAVLLDQDGRWQSKLEDSLAHNIIDGELEQHIDRLRSLRTDTTAKAGDGRRGGIGDVLALAGIEEDERRKLLSAYHAHDGAMEKFWNELVPQRLGWNEARINEAQTALQFADLLSFDMPLIRGLRERGVSSPIDLVQLDHGELKELITRIGPSPDAPGDTVEARIATTVDSITASVEATYPTETVARLVINSADPKLADARDLLTRFFQREPTSDGGFDLRSSPVTTYLEKHGERVFDGLEPSDKALLTSQLQRLQRVFRLGVDRSQTESLLELGLDSAFHVTRFSPEHFVEEFGDRLGGKERASIVYDRAEHIAGTVLYVYTDLWQGVHSVRPMALRSASSPETLPELKELPEYRALFGNMQLCECGHCQSFYSPAAYFVDLLHMLDRPTLKPNPVEVLFQRRPDLGHIQLTCENTNTLIPYVDLVTEVLESFVAKGAPTAFNVPPPPPNQKLPTPSADELRVNPVYLTTESSQFADQAYAALQQAVFSLTLPLNLPLETTRIYLDHLGANRAEMMTLLDRDPGSEPLMARAAEILCLSPEEFELITGAKFGGAPALRPATTAELFGLSTAPTPASLFNHAAPEFARNPANPDQRGFLIRSLQNVLSLISPPAIPEKERGKFETLTEVAVNAVLKKAGLPQNGKTDAAFWGALEADGMPSLSVLMCPVQFLLERSGLTYTELVSLVKTRFVNPTLQGDGDFDYLARLGIPDADVRAWIAAGLPAVPLPILNQLSKLGEDPLAFTEWVQARTRAVVINTGFESPCDLDRATLMHLDGTLLQPDELVTLFRFVRLWRKLGWSIEDLDQVLEPGGLESPSVFKSLLVLANVKQLHEQTKAPIDDLVCLWQSILTHGGRSLYDRLFRNRAAQLIDPILELNRERTELKAAASATPPAISDHEGTLLAGFRLRAQDLELLREALGLKDDPTLPPAARPKLNIAALSAIYRRASFAQALGLSVREFLSLFDLAGLAVFERPDKQTRGEALLFVELIDKVRAAGVKVSELEYLCRAMPQPSGLPATQREAWRRTLAAIIDGLHAIASEEPIEDDPAGEELAARLTALFGADEARTTTALIYGRIVYTASLVNFPLSFAFPAAVAGKISYDATRKQLRFSGAMTKTERLLLLGPLGLPAAIKPAFDQAIKSLDAQPRAFVARALGSMFLPADAEAVLIDVSSLDAKGEPVLKVIDAKIADVLARRRALLSRSLIKQTLTTATGLTAEIVGLLLENEIVLKSISGVGPAMEDYQTLGGDGLDAEYFTVPDLTGLPALKRIDKTIAFAWQGAVPAPGIPTVNFSVRWTGNLYVPAAGEVTFRVRCTDGVRVTVNDALVIDEWRDQPETEFTQTRRLDGGQFYLIQVEYYNKTGDAQLSLSWSSPSIPAVTIPQESLYTAGRLEALLQRVERIYKLALLLTPFNLTAHDLEGLAERGDISLDLLPLDIPAVPAAAQAMFAQWMALYDYATLRDRYQSTALSLIDVPNAPSPAEAIQLFATLSGAEADTIKTIVDGFSIPLFDPIAVKWIIDAPDLTKLLWWQRIASALALVLKTGAAPEQLFSWAKTRDIKQLPTGPETLWLTWTAVDEDAVDRSADNARLAQEAKNIVRARYDEEQWRTVARSLNDKLRERRRASLTAFVLAMPEMMRAHVSDTGRLFEYLLIDVEMDPCMETSRIKQGISSVQLFIQRVLLNLESPQVPPARVDSGRWKWMKNYRVWEANRKVFLYAESYVEADLRDDKTPIFKELESELLQDELNEANAERAFRSYLEKLDNIAKLVVCGTCVGSDGITLHVFGRTATAPFVFYHRRLVSPAAWTEGTWSPWQKLPVDVATIDDGENSGAHLVPITWNRRLYLFWPVFEQKPDESHNASVPEGFDRINCWHIKLAWSEYKDGRWSPKQVGTPFLVSSALITRNRSSMVQSRRYSANVIHHDASSHLEYSPPLGAWEPPPGHPNHEKFIRDNSKLVITPAFDEVYPFTITDDPFLNGTTLNVERNAAGQVISIDWAQHIHRENTETICSLLPKPAQHYLDASIGGSELAIRVFCRFLGVPTGHTRTVIEDEIAVVRDGRRSDRKERDERDAAARTEGVRSFQLVGTFHFPACSSELDVNEIVQTFDYDKLERPALTTNSFMALRHMRIGLEKATGPLRLTSGAAPILKAVPTRHEVIDSDNRSGFNRNGPFFYQDQRRCYLVTRQLHHDLYLDKERLRIQPDVRVAFAKKAVSWSGSESKTGLAAEASLRVNPWATNALERWAEGPSLFAAISIDEPAEIPTLSGTSLSKGMLVTDSWKDIFDSIKKVQPEYTFTPHWHPYTCSFMSALSRGGLTALFTLENESLSDAGILFGGVIGGPMPIFATSNFSTIYKPDPEQVVQPYPLETVDFTRNGSYSQYNWEIFFHAPMTVAMAHSRAGQHEEALRWFHFVFDPMTSDADVTDVRIWRFLPFRTADTLRIEETIALLTYTGSDASKLKQKADLQASIQEWLDNPFNPHIIARRRPVVYMKYVFMKYLDNLIAWADELFQRDTIESINEATQLYVLVANLLGPRPQRTPAPGPVAPETYQSLRGRLDALSNAQVDLETRLPFTQLFAPGSGAVGQLTRLPQTLYFCLPQNDDMLAYWDTIADRLFKIRHCMTIDGTVRHLPLFEPPIDPMLLVEAVAHGLDIGSVLNDLYAPLPRYRFAFTLQQAIALCNEVRSLGNALLGIIEKRDAEKLATLRSEQERQLLDQVKQNKRLQIAEAEEARQSLENTARMVTSRIDYYQNLLVQGLISEETDQLGNLDQSNSRQETASWIEATAQALNLVPNVSIGTKETTSSFGGSNLGAATSAVGRSFSYLSASHAYKANRASITGGHTRRAEDWRFQRDQAKRELQQVERQKAAARIRKEITQAELVNHETQIEQARAVEEHLRSKFTNDALYSYMEGNLRQVYFQCFQAAYEIAKRAERCWRYERGADASFIKYGAWDSSVRGLLAGERLYLQLKQMERAYLEQQVREFEITRYVSLVQLAPLALIALKETGSCEVEIPEWFFDLDYPGHYFRRLKNVSITIPAVVGPYTSLSATVTLLSSKVRESSRVTGNYSDDENYRPDHLAVEAVAVSTGQSDSGRFQLDFRDEKYLPFEGAGAISNWRIELPSRFRSFDYDTISDVILQLKYTARRDETLAGPALDSLQAELNAVGGGTAPLLRFFSLRHEFPTEWQMLRTATTHEATFTIPKDRFPVLVQSGAVTVTEVHSALILKESRPTLTYKATLTHSALPAINLDWPGKAGRYRMMAKSATVTIPVSAVPADSGWVLKITQPTLPADLDNIQDILIVFNYSVKI